ncbi:MAG: restriction endonuclease subunit S [Burkholderiaceae bacterium]|jgi:type I restriction enzyme S subunit|nr:restriction endonuclease subunit S [Burkholderiaceae bacterium]
MTGELPQGWAVAKLEQLVSPDGLMTDGDWVESKDQDPSGDVRLLQLADVGAGEFRDRSNRFLTSSKAKDLNCTFLQPGDVLIARLGDVLGKACLAPTLPQPSVTVVDVHVFRSGHPDLSHHWLMHLFNAQATQRALEELSSGTTRKRVTGQKLKDLEVCVPPAKEQQRIVSRIEELFSEIDEGERALERVGRLVERYRQSVLKAAVTGELSASWRLSIGTDRQRAVAGKAEIVGLMEAPELPPSWRWVSLGDLITRIEAGRSFTCDERPPGPNEHGLVKVSAVTWGVYDEAESKTITDAARVDLRYLIREGDFLFSRANTIELVGASVIVGRTAKKLLLSDKILRLTFSEDIKVWVDLVLKSWLGRAQIEALSTGNQESMRNIGQERIRMIQVPVPPVGERKAIEDMVARQLHAVADARQQGHQQARVSAALRQSILKAAFSGQLVPQDPRDEPASALLARLAAQPADAPATPRRRGRPAGRRSSLPNPSVAT